MTGHVEDACFRPAGLLDVTEAGVRPDTGGMHLGHCVSSLELRVIGYQFPDLEAGGEPPGGDSSDANWLVVSGVVCTAAGTAWSFRHPSLLTWELTELVRWLRQVADGAVCVATTVGELDQMTLDKCVDEVDEYTAAGWLTFTEPELRGWRLLRAEGAAADRAQPRVGNTALGSDETEATPDHRDER